MIVKWLLFILCLPSPVMFSPTYPQEDYDRNQDEKQSKIRDLSRYDKEGPYDAEPSMGKAGFTLEKLRGFLWEHWNQRKLGYIVTVFYSKEGDRSTSHDYVEPDESGEWHVAVRIERQLVDREHWAKTKSIRYLPEITEYKAYVLERTEIAKSKRRNRNIPTDQKRPPSTYLLRLKDKSGRLLVEV